MMAQLSGRVECNPAPQCTGEQARELLEGLRAAYQSLSLTERSFVKRIVLATEARITGAGSEPEKGTLWISVLKAEIREEI